MISLYTKVGPGRYASVDHLTNKIEQKAGSGKGFDQLISDEANIRLSRKTIDVGSLVELHRDNVSRDFPRDRPTDPPPLILAEWTFNF